MSDGTNGNQVGVVDPGLGTLSLGNGGSTATIALSSGSPAINAGDSALVPSGITTDQRGSSRFVGPAVDIGAYESASTQLVLQITFPPIVQQVYVGAAFTLALSATDSSGGTVEFAVVSGPATVSGDELEISGGGTVVVEASELGNDSYPPSPIIESITVIAPVVYTVDSTGDTGAGTLDEGDLLYCIELANYNPSPAGSVIVFAPSVFSTNASSTIALASTLELTDTAGPEVIDGPGSGVVTIGGDGFESVLAVGAGVRATLSGLTISGGGGTYGGGIAVEEGGSLKVIDSTIADNVGYDGAGIDDGGNVSVSNNSIIADNTSIGLGGGIFVGVGAILSVADSTVAGNTARYDGGGIFAFGKVTISDSEIDDQNSAQDGGGVDSTGTTASVSITNSTIAQNNAAVGGGIAVGGGVLTIGFSLISDNTATDVGGGINVGTGAQASVTNCTISGDSASIGGGVFVQRGALSISGSTLSGNTASENGGGIENDIGTLTITNSTIADNSGETTGGGIENNAGAMTVFDSTIAYNQVFGAPGSGAGIFDRTGSTTNLYNTIVALNTDGAGTGAPADDIAGTAVSAATRI